MTIPEAIQIKEDTFYKRHLHHQIKIDEADRLSIEALKRFQRYRRDTINSILDPLPGETKE